MAVRAPVRDAAVPVGIMTRILHWRWVALTPHGVLHLVPPRPGPLATTACWKPLHDAGGEQLALIEAGRDRCQLCLNHNGGVAS